MVVLGVAILTKSGKALLCRQFVEMNRSRVEGLLAAFPKLIGSGQQHTFVETENVRYVYQPLEELFLVLITTKTSNILEDLETLHLFARLVPEYCRTIEEQEIVEHAFELLFAFDEVVSLGYNENVQISQVRTFTEMESHEEKIQEMIAKNKEIEAKEQAKLHIKQMDLQRKEAAKRGKSMGIGSGPAGFGSGSMGSMGSLSSTKMSGFGGSVERTYSSSSIESGDYQSKSLAASKPVGGGRGMQLGKKQATNDFLEAMKTEEGLELEESPKVAATTSTVVKESIPTESVHIIIEEKLIVVCNRDGGLENLEVKGDLLLRISDPDKALIRVGLLNINEKVYQFKTHPNVDKRLFSEGKIGSKDPSRPFPVGQALGVLKWRYQSKDESAIPLSINCWPSATNDGSCEVNIEYELDRDDLILKDVVISIPIPNGSGNPAIGNIDGEYFFNKSRRVLEWQLAQIDASNKTGLMEFFVSNADPSGFFPVTVSFTSSTLMCGLQVAEVINLKDNNRTNFSSAVNLTPEEFSII